ncbi:hypothetical protein CROQUDRAFT_715884 [Cronartium quercuum f. sp. fusiforme G11]|uniref:MutL C-terminal dimerisation domain-containing protein n=1 Tax=Cronartium quercuum f. sp. fusiforme G11 TaxID=708437 RepID=A0A9P6NFF4_9BASI|nr:hypothetical protein CROQUDRAFT_715884 [Cronartium quercuum f. sp. fusiforme G11]
MSSPSPAVHPIDPPPLASSSARPIQALDPNTVALLRSGVNLPSLVHVLQCLVQIALDQHCRLISCSIDQESGFVRVDDDGIGLNRQSVHRIATDGYPAPETLSEAQTIKSGHILNHSQRPVFDSLAYVSLLDICSRTAESSGTHQTVFKDGEIMFSGPAKTSRRHSRGTTVTVRNLFYNLPVRFAQSAGHDRQNSHQLKRGWDECVRSIQYFAISYPHVTFALRNAPQSSDGLRIETRSDSKDLCIRITKTGNSMMTFGRIFGQTLIRDAHVIESFELECFNVQGFLGNHSHLDRSCQLIFLDRKIIPSTSPIHKHLQEVMVRSTNLHNVPTDPNIDPSYMRKSPRKSVSPSKLTGSAVKHHPVYLLLFTSRNEKTLSASYLGLWEHHLSPRTEESLSKICGSLCARFFPSTTTTSLNALVMEKGGEANQSTLGIGTKPKKCQSLAAFHHPDQLAVKRTRSGGSEVQLPSPRKRSRFDRTDPVSPTKPLRPHSTSSVSSRAYGPVFSAFGPKHTSTHQPRSPSDEHQETKGQKRKIELPETFGNRSVCVWTDPKTKETFEINALTGFSVPAPNFSGLSGQSDTAYTHSRRSVGRLRFIKSEPRARETPRWITGGLADYQSPVFGVRSKQPVAGVRDSAVPASLQGSSVSQAVDELRRPLSRIGNSACGLIRGASPSLKDRARLTPKKMHETYQAVDLSALAKHQFRLVGQADAKFIIVLLLDSQLLLVFDQHAVHERIRVESFLEVILQPDRLVLQTINSHDPQSRSGPEPGGCVSILVSVQELKRFRRWQSRFRRWGFIYELAEDRVSINEDEVELGLEQISVLAVPELVAVRLGRDHGLLAEVLRGCASFFDEHLHDLGEGGIDVQGVERSESNEDRWFDRLPNCPPMLVNLINSKACREHGDLCEPLCTRSEGAVMFGDRLEREECKNMINQLGSTHLPFQCAHGRPTCVPVLGLGTEDDELGGSQATGEEMKVDHRWVDSYHREYTQFTHTLDWSGFFEI